MLSDPATRTRPLPRRLVPTTLLLGGCFLLTGAAGLVYEVVWNRWLALVMGNTSYALATLLAVFMGGLALGAWVGGRFAPSGRRAVRLYGFLEIALGLYCLALPLLIDAFDPLFGAVYRELHDTQLWLNLAQFALAGLLLLVPTTLMGATLPILVHFLVQRGGRLGATTGTMYALNSGGAAAGCFLAGLVLIPSFGLRVTILAAVATNLVVGAAAVMLSSRLGDAEEPSAAGIALSASPAGGSLAPAVLLVSFGLSGFAAMVLQVAWTRSVTVMVGAMTYAFTMITGLFVLGLTLGSLVLGPLGDRRWGRYLPGVLTAGIALSAVATVAGLADLPIRMARLFKEHELSFTAREWGKVFYLAPLFLVPTFFMGGLLPVVARHLARGAADAGPALGRAYAANTVGTIAGSFAGGFLLIPLPDVGMRGSILLAAGLALLASATLFFAAFERGRVARWLAPLLVLAGGGALLSQTPRWEPAVVASGPFSHYWKWLRTGLESDAEIRRMMEREEILFYREGTSALVTVTASEGDSARTRNLIVSGQTDATNNAESQVWLAQLPMLLAPDARDVLVIGLGSGATLGSVLTHPKVQRVDCVEISEGVVEAARAHFADASLGSLDDARVHLIVGDGRQHLERTDRAYDVVVSQPSNPYISGSAAMFTRNAFAAIQARLRPDGLACAWFQGMQIPPHLVQLLARTWADVWPHASMWRSGSHGTYMFVGSVTPLSVDLDRLAERMQVGPVRRQLDSLGMPSPAHVLSYMLAANEELRAFAGGGPVNTDDNSAIEFEAPRYLGPSYADQVDRLTLGHRVRPWAFVTTAADRNDAEYLRQKQLAEVLYDNYGQLLRSANAAPMARIRAALAALEGNAVDEVAVRVLRQVRRDYPASIKAVQDGHAELFRRLGLWVE